MDLRITSNATTEVVRVAIRVSATLRAILDTALLKFAHAQDGELQHGSQLRLTKTPIPRRAPAVGTPDCVTMLLIMAMFPPMSALLIGLLHRVVNEARSIFDASTVNKVSL